MKKIVPTTLLFLFASLHIHAQWTEVSIPSEWPLQNAAFADANNGYIIVPNYPKMFRTTNGGSSWDSVTFNGGGAWDIDFISPTHGFVLVDSSAVFSVKTTTDGGNSWTNDTLPSNYYNMIRFTDANNGFATNNFGSVYNTTNGGSTWTALPMSGYSSASDKEFTGPDTIIFTGWDGTFAYQGSVIRRDGPGGFQELVMPTLYSQFQGTFFPSGNVGYAVFNTGWPTYKNYLTHTSDGGTSWDTVLTDTTSTIQFHDVWMNQSGNGYIVATSGTAGAIYKVTGTTFTLEFNTPKPIRRIHMGGNMLFAVGDGGDVFKNQKLLSVETEITELKGIYPNPTSDQIKIPVEIVSDISIANMSGQIVMNKTITPGDLISLGEFAPGVYTVMVTNSKGRSVGKIIVQK